MASVPKCERCRLDKKKCDFTNNPNLKCSRCAEKGFPCSKPEYIGPRHPANPQSIRPSYSLGVPPENASPARHRQQHEPQGARNRISRSEREHEIPKTATHPLYARQEFTPNQAQNPYNMLGPREGLSGYPGHANFQQPSYMWGNTTQGPVHDQVFSQTFLDVESPDTSAFYYSNSGSFAGGYGWNTLDKTQMAHDELDAPENWPNQAPFYSSRRHGRS